MFKKYPPSEVTLLNDIKMISCGFNHILCLEYNGNVYSLGSNSYGKLGISKNTNEVSNTHIPQQLNLPPIDMIGCGAKFSICLTTEGKLFSFGDNSYYQLGLLHKETRNTPTEIPNISDIEFISCAGNHVICKSLTNLYYSWGDNQHGQLGRNNFGNTPLLCDNWPDNVVNIKCGYKHTLLLTCYGYVYSFGSNDCGQLGITKSKASTWKPELIKDIPLIRYIECGRAASLCIDIDNVLWVFGNNGYGQLGLGDKKHRYIPVKNENIKDVIDISHGGYHHLFKTQNNDIYACGMNAKNQIGIKTNSTHQVTMIQTLKGKEEIWGSIIGKSRAKSARK